MARIKLIGSLKDKASILKATLSINRRTSSVRLAVLRATTHNPKTPPSDSRIASVLALGHSSRITACACIEALMDRLHLTNSAFVALKCLLILHNIVSKGSFILKDQLAFCPSFGGHNFLNLSMFCDKSDLGVWGFSSWVRWYAGVVEQNLMVSRAIGYYLNSSKNNSGKKDKEEEKALVLLDSTLVIEIEVLVEFVVRICDAPDSLDLQRNNLVYEVVRAAGDDYRSAQREILVRVKEVEDRMEELSSTELTQLIAALERLEGCKGKLILLFVNRKRNDGLWECVRQTRVTLVETKKRKEEKRLVKFEGKRDESSESTQFWNPFLEPGQLLLLPSGGEWLGLAPAPIAV